ncbi:MAG: hypothetical protein V7L29_14615 [Nostoc sp.]|uniref:hypothetical protein n=1 Tax=Nostoc sp. TaxID=1180 RepID=UPI002FF379F6
MKFRVQKVSVDAQCKAGGFETPSLSSDYRPSLTTINIVLFFAIAPLVTKEDSECDTWVELRQHRIYLSRFHHGYQYQAK